MPIAKVLDQQISVYNIASGTILKVTKTHSVLDFVSVI